MHHGAHHSVDIKVGSIEEPRNVADMAEPRLCATECEVQRSLNQVEFGSEGEQVDAANLGGDGRRQEFVEIHQMPART